MNILFIYDGEEIILAIRWGREGWLRFRGEMRRVRKLKEGKWVAEVKMVMGSEKLVRFGPSIWTS